MTVNAPPTPYESTPEDLALHGPRVLGYTSAEQIAARYHLDRGVVHDLLLDFEAQGWVRRTTFAGHSGWSITPAGCREDETRLSQELDRSGSRDLVTRVHADFGPLNTRFTQACTHWQIHPTGTDPLAINTHDDWRWDDRVLNDLTSAGRTLAQLVTTLSSRLSRFEGYDTRYAAALARAHAGQHRWIDSPEVDSCHTVWIQLHEDLLSTLTLSRDTGTT